MNTTDYLVIAPLVVREIVFRLLNGTQGGRMRHLATFGGQAHRMVKAVEKLRENFDKPLRIEAMAKGLEDTAYYMYARFISSNEVGGSPGEFGLPVAEFHRGNQERAFDFARRCSATNPQSRALERIGGGAPSGSHGAGALPGSTWPFFG